MNYLCYPNPNAGGVLNFNFRKSSGSHQVRIFDVNGRMLQEQIMSGTMQNTMQLNLLPGIYFVNNDSGIYCETNQIVIK